MVIIWRIDWWGETEGQEIDRRLLLKSRREMMRAKW